MKPNVFLSWIWTHAITGLAPLLLMAASVFGWPSGRWLVAIALLWFGCLYGMTEGARKRWRRRAARRRLRVRVRQRAARRM